jgi:hypothetical protein
MLQQIFDEPKAVKLWTHIFDAMYDKKGPDTWDYQWLYTNLKNNSLTVVPSVNLVANIGFAQGATHTTEADSRFMLPAYTMKFPLKHPSSFTPSRSLDRRRIQDMLPQSKLQRIFKRVQSLFAHSSV